MPQNQGITQPEQWFLGEQLRREQLCVKKCQAYATMIQDPQLRGSVQKMADACSKHARDLEGLSGQYGQGTMQ